MNRSIRLAMLGTLATDGALLLCGLLTGCLAARLLLPEGRGALAAVLFWPQLFAGLGLLSLNEAATYRIGSRPDRTPVVAVSCFWLALAMAGPTMLAGYMLVPFLLGAEREHLWSLARIYLVYIPFNFTALALLAVDQGNLRFTRFNSLRLLFPLIYLTGLVTLWVTDQVSVGWVVGINCAGSVLVALFRLALHGQAIRAMPSWKEALSLLGMALRFHPASVLLFLAAQADKFVVLTLWDNAALGRYAVALTLASTGLAVVSGAFQRVIFPHLANVQDPASQGRLLARGVGQATLMLAAISLPLALLMPWLLPLFFGPAFRDALRPAQVLLAAYSVVALNTILIQGMRGLGKGQPGFVAAGLSLLLFLVLAWPMGKSLGLVGVGTALGLANVGAIAYLAVHLRRRYQVGLRSFYRVRLQAAE